MNAAPALVGPDGFPTPSFVLDGPMVAVWRGNFMENVHRGSVAVTDATGKILAGYGNVQERVFLRSGAKPFQVMPALLPGAVDRFALTTSELSVLCSSHAGEPRHLEAVGSILHKIGLDESALQCGAHAPLSPAEAAERWRQGLEPTPACNNCSGSHAGMLAACVASGWTTERYGNPDHPLQKQIRRIVLQCSGAEETELESAVDACGVPTFRLPLVRAATAFARLASGRELPTALAGAAQRIRTAMTLFPDMVGGEGRFDTELMRAAACTLIVKGGAQGFLGIGHEPGGLGLAFKISGGGDGAVGVAALRALTDLDLLRPAAVETLSRFAQPPTFSLRGDVVGVSQAVYHLQPIS